MKVRNLTVISMIAGIYFTISGVGAEAGGGDGPKNFELNGKISSIYGHLLGASSVYDVEMTQLAKYVPGNVDLSSTTKGTVLRVYKGAERMGEEIKFSGGIVDWKIGDKVILFLDEAGKPQMFFVQGKNPNYENFVSAIRPFAGNISSGNQKLKSAIVGVRERLEKKCHGIESNREKFRCKNLLSVW